MGGPLLIGTGGRMNTLVPLFTIGVFVGFTLSQAGMVRHRWADRPYGRAPRAALNGAGAPAPGAAAIIIAITKFPESGGLIVAMPLLVEPIVNYVRGVGEPRVFMLIPEAEPAYVWQRVLRNQRGAVLAHALRRDTDAVVCRFRFRLDDEPVRGRDTMRSGG